MPDPVTGPPGMRCVLLVERETRGRRAKSARERAATRSLHRLSWWFSQHVSTLRLAGQDLANVGGRVVDAALNSWCAMGRADREHGADQRNPGDGRRPPAAVAAAAGS